MRDTASFARMVETSPEPITVTKNGYDLFVALRSDEYDKLCRERAKAQFMERMLIAEKERSEGFLVASDESVAKLRRQHGL